MRDATDLYATEAAKLVGATLLYFLNADFGSVSGKFCLWNGLGQKTWRSETYFSGLSLIKVDGGGENADGTTEPLNFSISWKDAATSKDFVQDALAAKSGGKAFLARGFMDDLGNIVSEPIFLWFGHVGVPQIKEGIGSIEISCTAEEPTSDKDRATRFRIDSASQIAFDPTDKGLKYQGRLSSQDLQWGLFYYKEQHSA